MLEELKNYLDLIEYRLKEPAFDRKIRNQNIGERHHIIPKSINNRQIVLDLFAKYGFTDKKQIVCLTYKEHMRVHKWLLVIANNLLDKDCYIKMSNAWQILVYKPNHKIELSEEEFEICKKIRLENIKGENNPNFGNYWSDEQKIIQSNKLKIIFSDPNKRAIGKRNGNFNKPCKNRIPIVQLDLNGNLVREYSYIEEVTLHNKNIKNTGHIVDCCKHKRSTYHKFIWLYKDEYSNFNKDELLNFCYKCRKAKSINNVNRKKIVVLNSNNVYINTYESITSLITKNNNYFKKDGIINCCKHKWKQYKNFMFLYENEYLKNNKKDGIKSNEF